MSTLPRIPRRLPLVGGPAEGRTTTRRKAGHPPVLRVAYPSADLSLLPKVTDYRLTAFEANGLRAWVYLHEHADGEQAGTIERAIRAAAKCEAVELR